MTEHALPLKHDEPKRGDTFRSAPSRDGGVKIKQINPAPDRWTLLPLDGWQRYDAWDRAEAELGQPYDLAGYDDAGLTRSPI